MPFKLHLNVFYVKTLLTAHGFKNNNNIIKNPTTHSLFTVRNSGLTAPLHVVFNLLYLHVVFKLYDFFWSVLRNILTFLFVFWCDVLRLVTQIGRQLKDTHNTSWVTDGKNRIELVQRQGTETSSVWNNFLDAQLFLLVCCKVKHVNIVWCSTCN